VSQYQYYEFLALDRPLATAGQAEAHRLSARARITATSFVAVSQSVHSRRRRHRGRRFFGCAADRERI
jgi:hypothetical protein